jgi:hypothetical protein
MEETQNNEHTYRVYLKKPFTNEGLDQLRWDIVNVPDRSPSPADIDPAKVGQPNYVLGYVPVTCSEAAKEDMENMLEGEIEQPIMPEGESQTGGSNYPDDKNCWDPRTWKK